MTDAPTLGPKSLSRALAKLQKANAAQARSYPGEAPERQPVHTVYGGAHLFKSDSAAKLGALALKSLQEYGPDFSAFAKAVGLPGSDQLSGEAADVSALKKALEADPAAVRKENPGAWLAHAVHSRVADKLRREAVEDFRIDFEDGYGWRPDAEEDRHAVLAAEELARGMAARSLPPFIGLRIKPLSGESHGRSLRTLDLFLTKLAKRTKGALPAGFVVTLPKITEPAQVAALAEVLDALEGKLKFSPQSLKFELMAETTQSIFARDGKAALPALVAAGRGRVTAAHFGTYDYTAACGITAAHQAMDHPACDFAKHVMQVSLAGTGVLLSDGAVNILPVGPHKAGDAPLSPKDIRENRAAVHAAWKLHYNQVRRSLSGGFYQGWDLHPAQLPTRYAAVYAFFLESLEPASLRLKTFVEKAAQATLAGGVFDDAATGQGLLNYFLRALNCGAVAENEILATGLTIQEIRARSFQKILETRRLKA